MNESLWRSTRNLRSVLLILGFYLAATLLAHTLLYTIVAYLVSVTDKTGTDFSNAVNEIAGQYHFFSFSLAALLMALTTWKGDRALYNQSIFWNDPHKPFWQLNRITKEELFRGASSGAAAVAVYLFLFIASGQGTYLGTYITSAFGTPVLPLFFLNFASLCVLLFCEEYIFRHKILRLLLTQMNAGAAVVVTSLLYLLVKHLQFDLSHMDFFNLGLMNLALGYFFLKSDKAHRGIGFMIVCLCGLHSMAGLPLWDNESPSFFLFKPLSRSHEILFGGGLGPFAGIALSSIFIVFALGSGFSWKREMETRRKSERARRA